MKVALRISLDNLRTLAWHSPRTNSKYVVYGPRDSWNYRVQSKAGSHHLLTAKDGHNIHSSESLTVERLTMDTLHTKLNFNLFNNT